MIIQGQPVTVPLRFGALTKQLRGRHWVSPDTFQRLSTLATTPYVGQLPVKPLGIPAQEVRGYYQALDDVTQLLSYCPKGLKVNLALQPTPFSSRVNLSYTGYGAFGTVFRLTPTSLIPASSYALKLYYPDKPVSTHGAYGELASGVYLSRNRWKDLAHFYTGNPQVGWGLYEFIDPRAHVDRRSGQLLRQRPDVRLGDDASRNSVGSIRVDYGDISRHTKPVPLTDFKEFTDALNSTDHRIRDEAVKRIGTLPAEHRLTAYTMATVDDDPYLQYLAAFAIPSIPKPQRGLAVNMSLQTRDPKTIGVVAYYVSELPLYQRKSVFDAIITFNDPDAMAILPYWLNKLPLNQRKSVFDRLMASRFTKVQAKVVDYVHELPVDDHLSAVLSAINTGKPEVLVEAASAISSLQPKDRYTLFNTLMQTHHPDVQHAAIAQLHSLTNPKELKEAFKWGITSPNKATQLTTLWQLGYFDKADRQVAIDHAVQSDDAQILTLAKAMHVYLPWRQRKRAYRQLCLALTKIADKPRFTNLVVT